MRRKNVVESSDVAQAGDGLNFRAGRSGRACFEGGDDADEARLLIIGKKAKLADELACSARRCDKDGAQRGGCRFRSGGAGRVHHAFGIDQREIMTRTGRLRRGYQAAR